MLACSCRAGSDLAKTTIKHFFQSPTSRYRTAPLAIFHHQRHSSWNRSRNFLCAKIASGILVIIYKLFMSFDILQYKSSAPTNPFKPKVLSLTDLLAICLSWHLNKNWKNHDRGNKAKPCRISTSVVQGGETKRVQMKGITTVATSQIYTHWYSELHGPLGH
ncbi:hypothetical protein J6590_059172 [Homalodisca vitripennis]|nr:hypothetical protein J6590_059172 [Homalodisca vitripennis]